MFCYQCEETANNLGCTIRGVCGKSNEVANLQDLLIYLLKGMSFYLKKLRSYGIKDELADKFIIDSLFSTITNANFDDKCFREKINEAFEKREWLRNWFLDEFSKREGKNYNESLPDCATFTALNIDEKAKSVGILSTENEDIRSLRWILIYGLKGMSAYTHHAYVIGYKDEEIFRFIEDSLCATESSDINELLSFVMKCGEIGFKTMQLLDKANTEKYGNPEPTKINIGVGKNPGILISGHDLGDMEELLNQTQGKGIDVYTHGEMLPANAYPFFKKYSNLIGNYGSSWWHQREEFEKFNGPIIMTTNCLVPPVDSYKDRCYVTGVVGYPGLKKIPERNGKKDFTEVIEHAKKCASPEKLEEGFIYGGFAHNSILNYADKILALVKSGKIKRFVVMGGCDGRQKDRDYYTEFAKALPKDAIILTAGCAKYRYNKLDLGDIDGIPRVLDAGQCNDSYSLVLVALKLKEVLGLKDVNDLPISYNLAWYEQKAALVLLVLLHAGIKNITLGPRLPAFFSKNVLKIIADKFNLHQNTIVAEDLPAIMGEKESSLKKSNALYKISYGMYAVSSLKDSKYDSFIANSVFQITANPETIAVSVSKSNLTHEYISSSKLFSISILSKDTPFKLIGDLGFKSGKNTDKLRLVKYKTGKTGVPIVLEHSVGYIEAELINKTDAGTHTIFIGKVVDSKLYNNEEPLTYSYYHEIKEGKSPEACPTYVKETAIQSPGKQIAAQSKKDMSKYKCLLCGYIYDPAKGDTDSGIAPGTPFAEIPDDWVCPVCGVKKDQFERMPE